jgi:hypothetical protein
MKDQGTWYLELVDDVLMMISPSLGLPQGSSVEKYGMFPVSVDVRPLLYSRRLMISLAQLTSRGRIVTSGRSVSKRKVRYCAIARDLKGRRSGSARCSPWPPYPPGRFADPILGLQSR